MADRFESVQAVREGLKDVKYLADEGIAGVAFLADRLGKPVLVEGPAGTGKTQLAKSVAEMTGARLIRLQCYEGLDESKALYEWNYKKQLLRIQAERGAEKDWEDIEDDIFSDEFLLTRPLLEAIRAEEPVVLLIDEVDRVEVETEALLLEILSDYQVSIPELGTITATQVPLVFLTSNNTRELSEALKRRCLFLHIDYPDMEREKQIVERRIVLPLQHPEVAERHGVAPPKAVILFGPPGTGKTSFAKAVASRLSWPFVELFPSRLAAEPGAGLAAALRDVFAELAGLEAVLLFIDEVEEIAGVRAGPAAGPGHGVTNELLKLIPGFREHDDRLLICATNSVRSLDPAFMRPGRFDHVIPIGPPDAAAREAIWRRYLGPASAGVDLSGLVAASEMFTPADIEFAARKGAQTAFER